MISKDKKYKLRDGREAIIYTILDDEKTHWKVHGAHKTSCDTWQVSSWDINGRISANEESSNDLIEVSPYDDFKIDDKVLCRFETGHIDNGHFAGIDKNGKPMAWFNGKTSFSSKGETTTWDHCIKYEENNDN